MHARRHCRRCDFWRASSRTRLALTGYLRMSRAVLSTNVAIVLIALILSAHADEQNLTVQTDTAPIENPPLPRPKPPLVDATGDNPAVLISAFRHQHGEGSVVINVALTRIAQEQANAMAIRDLLEH